MTLAAPIDLRVPYSARQAPQHATALLCDALGIKRGDRVLEPSAGAGGMVEVIKRYTRDVTAIEINPNAFKKLGQVTQKCYKRDFLLLEPGKENRSKRGIACNLGYFDYVVMCPPARSDEHITHALKFLKPGGKLGALVLQPHINQYRDSFIQSADRFQLAGVDITAGYIVLEKA